MISVNKGAHRVVEQLLSSPEKYNVKVQRLPSGATVIDTGVEVTGGFLAGIKVTEICIGGLGHVYIGEKQYGEVSLPTIFVSTDHPAVSLLGSQLAGWNIKIDEFSAVGSGPARALALKPKKIFKRIEYKDESDVAVLVLETEGKPNDAVAEFVCESCKVKPEKLFMVIVSNRSLTGLTQIAGRIVETGLYRLNFLGLDPKSVLHGIGSAPIMPLHPDPTKSMARGNDSLFYGGDTQYIVDYEDENELRGIVENAPSSTSKDYGKLFYDAYKAAGFDFYRIDVSLFAPAKIKVFNRKTGSMFEAGKINSEVLVKSIMNI